MNKQPNDPCSREIHEHGPENSDFEIRKAFNLAVDIGTAFFWDRRTITGIDPGEVEAFYKHAFHCHRKGNKLAAERWARATKHLARAFYHEAKIAFLEQQGTELPYLKATSLADLDLRNRIDMTSDLLDSVSEDLPPGMSVMPEDMKHYLARGRKHLQKLNSPDYTHELLRVERIKAAHEYGRVLECLALAHEADSQSNQAA